MCDAWCKEVVAQSVEYWKEGADVLDVGSLDVNGQSRDTAMIKARSYLGVDIQAGRNVDRIVAAERLLDVFPPEGFDVVISTEMLEHCEHWREAVYNMFAVLKVGGIFVLTTRSKGFIRHGYPSDYWRFEVEDLQTIFGGMGEILYLGKDREDGGPGCGIILRKTVQDLSEWEIDLQRWVVHDINIEV